MEPVACPNSSCPSGGTVQVLIRPIMHPGEDVLCPECNGALALTTDQRARATLS